MTKDELIEIACAAWRNGAFPEHFPWDELPEETQDRYRTGMLAALQAMAIAVQEDPLDLLSQVTSDIPIPDYEGLVQALEKRAPQGS